jgi:hypothetical protein
MSGVSPNLEASQKLDQGLKAWEKLVQQLWLSIDAALEMGQSHGNCGNGRITLSIMCVTTNSDSRSSIDSSLGWIRQSGPHWRSHRLTNNTNHTKIAQMLLLTPEISSSASWDSTGEKQLLSEQKIENCRIRKCRCDRALAPGLV